MPNMRLFITRLLVALFLANAAAAGRPGHISSGFVAVPRQVPAPIPNANPLASPQCLDYSRTANFSTIGSNTTLRSAFIQASPVGTISNLRMLAAAVAALPPMTANFALNQACGNLTTIAAVEVDRNFSQGIIAGFTGVSLTPDVVENDWPVIFSVVFCVLVLCIPWLFMLD